MKDEREVRVACVYYADTWLARSLPAFCFQCNRLIAYDPEHDKVIRRRYPKAAVKRWCYGCAGTHRMSDSDLRAARETMREVLGSAYVDAVSDDVIRRELAARARQ